MTNTTPEDTDQPAVEPDLPAAPPLALSQAALGVAILWAVVAIILAIVLLTGAKEETYGADAYTGIQNGVVLAVRGIAFLLFGSAALGLVIALRRDRR